MQDHIPDEDVPTIPEAWRRTLHARRGGAPGPAITVDARAPETVRALVAETGGAVESLLEDTYGDRELAAAARRYLDGGDDPVGAGAVAAATAHGLRHQPQGGPARGEEAHRAFVDAWVTERGIAFAACALVELGRTETKAGAGGSWGGTSVGAFHHGDEKLEHIEPETARRVRGLLAAADEPEYAEAVERLARHRSGPGTKWFVSYLVPTRDDWVDECCAGTPCPRMGRSEARWMWLSALGKASQLRRLAVYLFWGDATRAQLATIVDGVGPGALGFLLEQADGGHVESTDRRRIFEAVAVLPTDEAFQALVDRLDRRHVRPALDAAAGCFPVRALRLLARAGKRTDGVLRDHVRAHPELVAAALPGLPDDVRAVVEPLAATSARVPVAGPESLPGVLVDPPWARPSRPAVPGLREPAPRIVWRDGEREKWLAADPGVRTPDRDDWDVLVQAHLFGRSLIGGEELVLHGPEDLVRPLLRDFEGYAERDAHTWVRVLVARYELDALPAAIRMAKPYPETCVGPLLPFLDAGLARLMAGWLVRGGAYVGPARRWLRHHGLDAVPLLVPAALGQSAKRCREAETALRYLNDAHALGAIADAARDAHGEDAGHAIEELLAAEPAETGLDAPARIGDWADPAVLPQVLLRGHERALPPDATRRLLELFALPSPYVMDEPAKTCDPDSVAEFGWAVFQRWLDAGHPPKDVWALTQLARTGDDETAGLLAAVIRTLPGKGGHKLAVRGLDVLAEIGSDAALTHLNGIARKVAFKGLRAEAEHRIEEVAERLGLSPDQLADRLVPTFGLDADGAMTLDYGPRRFLVRFDEQLRPFVTDEDGKRRKTLPKPGVKDDPELAPAAHQAFTALKKEVRGVASDQLLRLEQAMAERRCWTPVEFGEFIVGHPLVRHIARRLVWIALDGGDATAFRVAEDGTFADAADDAFALPSSADVLIAHPLHLGDALKDWAEVFADYEILQPFPQLGRSVHALTEAEKDGGRLERFEGVTVPFGKVLGLVRLGWERGEPQDAGGERWISRRVGDDRYVVIDLYPGITVGNVGGSGDHQTLSHVWFATRPDDYRVRVGTPLRFGELDAVTASEILSDLIGLAEADVR
ncbi:DUF4132 domain-containing protein [Actinomadura meridiana]